MSNPREHDSSLERARINVDEKHDVEKWSEKFNVTPEHLKKAVSTVGDHAEAVQTQLKGEEGAARASRRRF